MQGLDHHIPGSKSLTWNDLDHTAFPFFATLYIVATDFVLYPADLLTTRLQNDKYSNQSGVKVYPLIRNIFKKEGITGLYRGFGTFAVGSFPGQLSYLLTYEYMNEKIRQSLPRSNFYNHELIANAIAGMSAELVSVFSFLPADVVSQRLQVERKYNFLPTKYRNTGPISIIRKILHTEGINGFFRGLAPYFIVFGPGSAIWWMSYEWSKKSITSIVPLAQGSVQDYGVKDHLQKGFTHLFCGSVAGVCSTLVTNPLDIARTRLQLMEYKNQSDQDSIRQGFLKVLRDIYKNEGFSGLYKGLRPRILVKIPGSAIAFLGYEYLKDFVSVTPK